MDPKHAADLKPGARIVVHMAKVMSDAYGHPPLLTTATVVESDGVIAWCDTDIAQGQTLPQAYRIQEDILGFLMPMATVTQLPDGSIEGRLPEGYVGP